MIALTLWQYVLVVATAFLSGAVFTIGCGMVAASFKRGE